MFIDVCDFVQEANLKPRLGYNQFTLFGDGLETLDFEIIGKQQIGLEISRKLTIFLLTHDSYFLMVLIGFREV